MPVLSLAIGTHHTRHKWATDDWITPPEIIAALGTFDLDPCALLGGRRHSLDEEVEERTLLLEGIMAIQSGDNPRVVAEKLMSFVPPAQRDEAQNADPKLSAVPDAAAA